MSQSTASPTAGPALSPGPVVPPQPAPRLPRGSWLNGRLALGVLLIIVSVLGGALFLQRAQQTVPVYVAARDMPSGHVLAAGDLAVAQVRLPGGQLERYLRPAAGQPAGKVLVTAVQQGELVPVRMVAGSVDQAGMVEFSLKVEAGDAPEDLRPGDRVDVVAAFTDGGRDRAELLLHGVEVLSSSRSGGGIAGGRGEISVEVRMPAQYVLNVARALASARVFISRSAPGGAAPGQLAPPLPQATRPAPADQQPTTTVQQ